MTKRFIELTYDNNKVEFPVLVRVDAIETIMPSAAAGLAGSHGCYITFTTSGNESWLDADIHVKESYAAIKALVIGDE
jgi:hypothetical protein